MSCFVFLPVIATFLDTHSYTLDFMSFRWFDTNSSPDYKPSWWISRRKCVPPKKMQKKKHKKNRSPKAPLDLIALHEANIAAYSRYSPWKWMVGRLLFLSFWASAYFFMGFCWFHGIFLAELGPLISIIFGGRKSYGSVDFWKNVTLDMSTLWYWGSDLGGQGWWYFPTKWGARLNPRILKITG